MMMMPIKYNYKTVEELKEWKSQVFSVKRCLEHSIFVFLTLIFKLFISSLSSSYFIR